MQRWERGRRLRIFGNSAGQTAEEKGMSKNKLSHKTEMNWKQIENTVQTALLGWTCMRCASCVLC